MSEIPVQIDAEKFVLHTLKITSNCRNFPKKYRYTIVDRLIRISMDIHDAICYANNTYNKNDRIYFIEKAISHCRNAKFYIKMTHEILHPQCSIEHWNGIVCKIEKQLINWRASTKK